MQIIITIKVAISVDFTIYSTLLTCYSGFLKYSHLDIPAIILVWLAIDVYCTKLALNCGHSLFPILASTGCPKLGFQ